MAACEEGWRYANRRGSLEHGWFAALERLDSEQHWVCHSEKKIVVSGSGYDSNKNGDEVTLQKWGVLIL